MSNLEARILFLIGAMIGASNGYAGPPDPPNASTSSPTPTAAAAAPATPSPDVLKRARLAGYHIKRLREGTTMFCKQEVHVGSRFSTNSCIDETQLEEILLRAQSQRDSIRNHVGTQTVTK